ncbi:NAD(P)/FAD-dependent oxidoreductase [Candidatus Aerophobetes bacterium]|uniref:NAD(P)/FAD-dependent oxidoreductase n=1 Tax=Aerophobetes bacterium TaxID=2030807 RepID=A0A497E4M3_UNCAE|nr:MAG: NAD(P)/FAD-dependent oxidoreductase [Candidatus Aerophobetes bacterium]
MHYLIVGNCAAGVNAIEGIRKLDKDGEITVISNEDSLAYCRCLLTEYVMRARRGEDILYREEDFYKKNRVNLILGKEVVGVDVADKKVILQDESFLPYDKLLIATGATPKSLRIKGEEKYGVFGFRRLSDAEEIIKIAERTGKAVVFGGGLIGLKAAYGMKKRGIDVYVMVKSPRVLSQVVDAEAAQIIGRWLQENGISIRTGIGPQEILGDDEVEEVILDNGEKVRTNLVIVGKGVMCNTSLVKGSPIKTHWGILTDDFLQTNIEGIFAAGDVAETTDIATGNRTVNALWTAACEQGRIAGMNMVEMTKRYPGSIGANSADFFGLPFISVGFVRVREEGYEQLIRSNPKEFKYKKVVLKGNRLVGFTAIKDIENAGVYTALIRKKVNISPVKDILLEDYLDYPKVRDLLEEKEGLRESISMQGDTIRIA